MQLAARWAAKAPDLNTAPVVEYTILWIPTLHQQHQENDTLALVASQLTRRGFGGRAKSPLEEEYGGCNELDFHVTLELHHIGLPLRTSKETDGVSLGSGLASPTPRSNSTMADNVDIVASFERISSVVPAARHIWTVPEQGSVAGLYEFVDGFSTINAPVNDSTKEWVACVKPYYSEPKGAEEIAWERRRLTRLRSRFQDLLANLDAINGDSFGNKEGRKRTARRAFKEYLSHVPAEGMLSTGKWLYFVPANRVNALVKQLTHSMVNGALSRLDENVYAITAGHEGQYNK